MPHLWKKIRQCYAPQKETSHRTQRRILLRLQGQILKTWEVFFILRIQMPGLPKSCQEFQIALYEYACGSTKPI